MELYVLRHGIAEPRREGLAEAKRQITDEGAAKLRLVLKRARSAKVRPTLILTSPYVRAAKSAEMAAEILDCRKRVVRTDALLPSASSEAVWEEIRSHRNERAILLAGHEPQLSQAASYLLGASWDLLELKKGALAYIAIEQFNKQPRGVLRWLLTPKLTED